MSCPLSERNTSLIANVNKLASPTPSRLSTLPNLYGRKRTLSEVSPTPSRYGGAIMSQVSLSSLWATQAPVGPALSEV
jgi:hypothetical protein